MATATTKTRTSRTKAKPAPVVEETTEVVDEVEETEETEELAFGVADIVALIKTKLKADTTTRELRTLLRKMARDGRLDREIVAGNRARWEWSGPEDPEVKAILKAFKDGELEADKKEKLDALKQRKAEQKAAAAAEAEKEAAKPAAKSKAKAKAAPVEDEDDEELEDDES